jgi:hypothetical protein
MAGFSDYIEPFLLDAVFNNGAGSVPTITTVYVKLHIGDPGEAGTANPAAETTRQSVTFAAAVGGSITSSGTVSWNNVSTTETITYISFWDNSTAGNCLGTAQLNVAAALQASDDLDLTSIVFTLD